MTCARREAGAHRPAASTPAGSARPDPRSGRRRARLSLLLPVLALLALFAAAPAPAEAQEDEVTVWRAVLTVDQASDRAGNTAYGCGADDNLKDCAKKRVLTRPKVKVDDTRYEIRTFYWDSDTNQVVLEFKVPSVAESTLRTTVFKDMTLHLPGKRQGERIMLRFNDADANSDVIWWSGLSDLGWRKGQVVGMTLTAPPPPEKPAKITGLEALPMSESVLLTWDEVRNDGYDVNRPFEKIQVQQKVKGGDWTEWKDLGLVARHTVTGLENGKRYSFRVRAVGPGGEGPRTQQIHVKPLKKPAPPGNLLANSADGSVILHWDYPLDDALTMYAYRVRAATGGDWKGGWITIPERHENESPYMRGGRAEFTVTGLSNGTEYEFAVRAANAAGWGRPSEAARATPRAVPAKPLPVTVPHDSALIPTDADGSRLVKPGESFRVMFVTANPTSAERTDIGYYNQYVQQQARRNSDFNAVWAEFRAVISTATVSARDNIDAGAAGNRAPVYWHRGGRVVGGCCGGDLFEDEWQDATPKNDGGGDSTVTQVWTGSLRSGNSWSLVGGNEDTRFYAGARWVWTGNPTESRGGISHATWDSYGTPPTRRTRLPVYGISPLITVEQPSTSTASAIWSATLTVDGGSSYGCNGRDTWPFSHDACSSALTDDDFTHGGVDYTIDAVTADTDRGLLLRFSGIGSATAKTALSALTLTVGAGPTARSFRISDATVDGVGQVSGADVFLKWGSATTLGWEPGDTVALKLTSPPPPPPPQTVWSATLTAKKVNSLYGCSSSGTFRCSTATVLTDDEFTYKGTDYTVANLYFGRDSSDNPFLAFGLSISLLSTAGGLDTKNALASLTLHVDGDRFAIDDATVGANNINWPFSPSPDWTDGQKVSVKLTGAATTTTPKPAKPAGLTATAEFDRATLSWTDPGDSGITRHQYRQKEGSGAWSVWRDIPNSASGEANAASYTVTGLKEGTSYAFRLRAVNALGAGPEADEATATTATALWSATLTVDEDTTLAKFGCSTFVNSQADCRRALSNDGFTFSGIKYRVREVNWANVGTGMVTIKFNKKLPKSARNALTLVVGSDRLALSDSFISTGDTIEFNNTGLAAWTDGQKVSLRLATGGAGIGTPPPPPTSTPAAVWSAMLTVDYASNRNGSPAYGCDNERASGPAMDNCSATTVLTDDDFDYPTGGTAYTVDRLYHNNSGSVLSLGFSGVTAAAAKTALTGLTLTVGTGTTAKTFAIADAGAPSTSGSALTWSSAGLSWSDGDTVSLSLTAPAAAKPAKPAGLTATAGDGQVALAWTDPSDSGITKYQYQRKEGSGAYGSWTDIPGSGATTTSYTVTGLKGGTAYAFKLRAVNAAGAGPESDEATATTPAAAVWSATLTVAATSSNAGCYTSGVNACSALLTQDKFTHGGIEYTITGIFGVGDLSIHTNKNGARAALSGLTLTVGSGTSAKTFKVSDATSDSSTDSEFYWTDNQGLSWSANDMVALKLTATTTMAPTPGAPGLQWARVNGSELALRFDAALDESSAPSASAFSVSVAGAARAVSSVAVSGDLVTLTLASAVSAGEAVTLGYAPPAQGPALRLSGGGAAVAAFSGQAVANDTPAGQPQVQGPPGTAEPLTASVASAPSEHRGTGGFELRIAFSAPVAGRAKDAAIEVSGGTLARASRVNKRQDLWALTVNPSGYGAVAVTLPATADCAAAGAVCTADGRRLETALTHAVPGPVTVSVADARAKEGEDATLDFAVTLSRAAAGEVAVTYATRDGTAKKGRDYRLAKGTLVFAAGETAKTVEVAILDDAHDEGEETLRLVSAAD